ncbi:relA-associated inhibitor isoform X1 [Gadus morhua]|uniref:relA-associated inhibitor isoform X1 n=2 Tax=Gadus morhua TaxID=8049 RepID=UPI0011B84DCC|nr:relA-associated inhibitor-like isoform X1 [Gadus morhua]
MRTRSTAWECESHRMTMTSQTGYSSNMMFQSISNDLNASLATADELSREFNSLMHEATPTPPQPGHQTSSLLDPAAATSYSSSTSSISRDRPMSVAPSMTAAAAAASSTAASSTASRSDSSSSIPSSAYSSSYTGSSSTPRISCPQASSKVSSVGVRSSSSSSSSSSLPPRPHDALIATSSRKLPPSPLTSPQPSFDPNTPLKRYSATFTYAQQQQQQQQQQQVSPNQSPRSGRRNRSPRSPRKSPRYMESSPAPSPTGAAGFDQWQHGGTAQPMHPSGGLRVPHDTGSMGRRSPGGDRSSSPRPFGGGGGPLLASTLPRNFGGVKHKEEGLQQQQTTGRWNETDLDAFSSNKKHHHTYDTSEWMRPVVPGSGWRESNLDGPTPAPAQKKDSLSGFNYGQGSLPRNTRIAVPPDPLAPPHYLAQPIVSRISIPPANARPRQRKPIPLSVIMRLQNPNWAGEPMAHPHGLGMAGDFPMAPPSVREIPPPSSLQPAFYAEVLNSGDVDAELEKLDLVHYMPPIPETSSGSPQSGASEGGGSPTKGAGEVGPPALAPRPLSPTRLQPVVAPQAHAVHDMEEVFRIRAEIPRALKRRSSVDQSLPQKKASQYQPNQYKHLINKLFRRTGRQRAGEKGSDSSDGEETLSSPPESPAVTPSPASPDYPSYHSILRRSKKQNRAVGRRAHLNPLVLLLDGALVGELETVQKAVQEMSDPSQPNDEGITALHNAICGGHYNVVDFLVRIGANVSAPDSHGWTPLHCSASCNDRPLCEFLVRNGAAVMATTESDGATAAQKCDPYALGFEECESFLRGVEEAMGADNSGVLYALWSYQGQAADELGFNEGDMVTILQKAQGVDWWWASLCGREGFVPNNYFGLFPKVRPKSLC